MPNKQDYINQGYSERQINLAITGKKLGQVYDEKTGQYQAPSVTPTSSVAPTIGSNAKPVNVSVIDPKPAVAIPTPPIVTNPVTPIVEKQSPPTEAIVTGKYGNEKDGDLGKYASPEAIVPVETPKAQKIAPVKGTPIQVTPDYNVGKGREGEISQHLSDGITNDPKIQEMVNTGNRDAFNAKYQYSTADETKRHILDSFFQSQQPQNSEAYFSLLAGGMKLQKNQYVNMPEARVAQHRYDVISPYKGASSNTIYNSMVDGPLTPGSEGYKDLVSMNGGMETPELLQAKEKFENKRKIDSINMNSALTNAGINGKDMAEKPDATQKLSEKIINKLGYDAASRFKETVMNNKDLKTEADSVSTTSKRIKELDRVKQSSFAELKKQYPGLPVGSLIVLSNQQNQEIDKELNGLRDDLSISTANLQYKTSMAEKMFQFEYDQQAKIEAQASKLDDRAYQTQQDERQFVKQKQLADIQNKYQTSRDVQNYNMDLAKLGITDGMQTNRDKLNFSQQKELTVIQNKYQTSRDVQNYNMDINKLKYQYENSPESVAKSLENAKMQNNGYFSILGNGKVTGYGGTYDGFKGLDVDGKKGDPVYGFGGKVLNIIDANYTSSPYGNSVLIQDEQGNEIRLSHLDSINIKPGQTLSQSDIIGALGNTGNVVPGKGGDGSHLDIRIKQAGQREEMSSKSVEQFLRGYGKTEENPITDKQFTQFNQMYSKFTGDPGVKAFESALSGGGDLIASLRSSNGPGDVGAVFGFMKSLDPASVVKEGEFQLAAKSAGVWEQFKNIPANKLEGAILTEDQRKAFGKLAFEYIKSKSRLYDVKYNDMAKVLNSQKIPASYMPTKMSDYIGEYESQNSQPKGNSGPTVGTKTSTYQDFYN